MNSVLDAIYISVLNNLNEIEEIWYYFLLIMDLNEWNPLFEPLLNKSPSSKKRIEHPLSVFYILHLFFYYKSTFFLTFYEKSLCSVYFPVYLCIECFLSNRFNILVSLPNYNDQNRMESMYSILIHHTVQYLLMIPSNQSKLLFYSLVCYCFVSNSLLDSFFIVLFNFIQEQKWIQYQSQLFSNSVQIFDYLYSLYSSLHKDSSFHLLSFLCHYLYQLNAEDQVYVSFLHVYPPF